jgi:hypothetical protein
MRDEVTVPVDYLNREILEFGLAPKDEFFGLPLRCARKHTECEEEYQFAGSTHNPKRHHSMTLCFKFRINPLDAFDILISGLELNDSRLSPAH